MLDNEFILGGYRRPSFSYIQSLWSIVQLHNETVNIWSHLLGAIYFLAALLKYSTDELNQTLRRRQDTHVVLLYYGSVATCFLLSTIFHTFSDHSPQTHKRFNKLDHLGIVFVLWGAGVSAVHFTFYCDPPMRDLYLAVMTSNALGCAVVTLKPQFRDGGGKTLRLALFAFLDFSMFSPMFHGLWRYGPAMERMMGLGSFVALAVINFPGVAMYMTRTPERWFPGRFDMLGQSHNWMHVLVIVAVVVRLRGLLRVAEFWQTYTEQYGFCYGFPGYE